MKIWFQLVQLDNSIVLPYNGSTADKVTINHDADIVDLKKEIKKECSPKLNHLAASDILVYENEQQLKEKNLFKSSQSINGLGKDEDNALLVLVPQTQEVSRKRKLSDLDDAPENFQLFWTCLKNIEISKCQLENTKSDEDIQYKILDFSLQLHNIPFLNDSSITNKIFIRKSYEDLSALVFKHDRFLLTGNPGIGKSVFLIYLLYKIRQKEPGTTIVLHRQKDRIGKLDLFYIFTPDSVKITGNLRDVDEILSVRTNYYLLDTINPGAVCAKTIEVSSPRKDHYKEFKKYYGTEHFFMPIWSFEELRCVVHQKIISLEEDILFERFELIGGIARLIFNKNIEELNTEIEKAILKTDLSCCLKSIGEIDSKEDASHVLIPLHVDESGNYQNAFVKFASNTIVEKVIAKKIEHSYLELIDFLKNCTNGQAGIAASMFGQLFEFFAHKKLLKGSVFTIKKLEKNPTNSTSSIIIPANSESAFKNLADCTNQNNYYKPKSKIFSAVNSIVLSIGFFQMTVSKDLKRATKKIYFVVPNGEIFENFCVQRFETMKGVEAKNINSLVGALEQFALCMEFN